MSIRHIETAAEGLAVLTEVYKKLLGEFDADINNRIKLLQLEMTLESSRQKKLYKPTELLLQAGTYVAAFFAGPIGNAIGEALLQSFKIVTSDGNWKEKTINLFIAAAQSEALKYGLDIATTRQTGTDSDGNPIYENNWRNYRYSANTSVQQEKKISKTTEVSPGLNQAQLDTAMLSGTYRSGTAVNSLLAMLPKQSGLRIGSRAGQHNSNFKNSENQFDKDNVTLEILRSANRDMSLRIFQLKSLMLQRDKYNKITYYYGLSMATQNISIKDSHLGLKSREVIKLFYTGGLSQFTNNAILREVRQRQDRGFNPQTDPAFLNAIEQFTQQKKNNLEDQVQTFSDGLARNRHEYGFDKLDQQAQTAKMVVDNQKILDHRNYLQADVRQQIDLYRQNNEATYEQQYYQNTNQEIIQLLAQGTDESVRNAKQARQELLDKLKKQTINSEIFARSTDYQRIYDGFPFEDQDTSKWSKIDVNNQSKSLYFFYHFDPAAPKIEEQFKESQRISSESFFEYIDTKILIRAYLDDYSSYYNKKIAGSVKANELRAVMPPRDKIGGQWHATFKNDSRVKDLVIIYLVITLPQILLGSPLVSQLIRNKSVDVNIQKEDVQKIYAAIFNGVWSACCFYKQTQSGYNSAVVWKRVSAFIQQIPDVLLAPFTQVTNMNIYLDTEYKSKLNDLGINNDWLVSKAPDVRANDIITELDQVTYQSLKPFVRATTSHIKRTDVHWAERNNNKYDGDLYDFNDRDQPAGNRLGARYIHKKLLGLIKKYVKSEDGYTAKINSFKTDTLIKKLPDRSDKLEISEYLENQSPDKIINYYQGKGVDINAYSNGNANNYLTATLTQRNQQLVGNLHGINPKINNLFLNQQLSIEALLNKSASQEEVLQGMHETMLALAEKVYGV